MGDGSDSSFRDKFKEKAADNKGKILIGIAIFTVVCIIIVLIVVFAGGDDDSTTTDVSTTTAGNKIESETKCDEGKELVGTECLVKCTDGKIRNGKICENPQSSTGGGPTWEVINNYDVSPSSTHSVCGGHTTLDSIRLACINNPSCVGFSVHNGKPWCLKSSLADGYTNNTHVFHKIKRS